jgi:tetratricopeptide (TPR) repeat protein
MKKTITLLTLVAAFTGSCTEKTSDLDNAKALYAKSLENNDAITARVALNQILMIDSTNAEYQDSLSRVYMTSGNFEGGLKYAEEVYNAGKASNKLKENMALAYQQIGEMEKSEEFIGALLRDTRNNKYLFQQLVIKYESGNQPMFDSLSTQILELSDSDSTVAQTMVPMPSPVSGGNQLVPIKAATLFLIGNNALERKQDVRTAITYLRKSLQEYEQFEMSRYVLMEIEKMMMGGR